MAQTPKGSPSRPNTTGVKELSRSRCASSGDTLGTYFLAAMSQFLPGEGADTS